MKIIIFILSLFVSALAHAKIETVCKTQEISEKKFDYCVRKNSESKAVVYFFHGIMGSSTSYKRRVFNYLDPIWEKKRIPLPNVVAISFGSSWVMSEAAGGHGLYKYFSQIAQPFLEKQFGFDSSFRRMVIGESMGGFNAVQAFAKNPGSFVKAAFLCPALHTITPYATDSEIDAFIQRTGAYRQLVSVAQNIGQGEFKSVDEWNQDGPFAVADKMPVVDTGIFMAVGDRDQFGFQEGTLAFAEFMKNRTAKVDFYLIKDGGHCSWPVQELADYIEPALR